MSDPRDTPGPEHATCPRCDAPVLRTLVDDRGRCVACQTVTAYHCTVCGNDLPAWTRVEGHEPPACFLCLYADSDPDAARMHYARALAEVMLPGITKGDGR